MRCVKIACVHCSKRRECPSTTRLFVNYCGAAARQMDERIREAILECRSRKGYLFKRDFAVHGPILPALPAIRPRRAA